MLSYARLGLIALLVLLFSVATAFGGGRQFASKIQTADGSVYEEVVFRVDRTYKIVTLEIDGTDRNVSFTDIVAIFDEDGIDVTEQALGGKYQAAPPATAVTSDQPSGETESLEQAATESQQRKPRKTPFGLGIQVNSCVSLPVGDWFQGISTSFGFGGDLIIPLTHDLALRGTISKAGLTDDVDEIISGGEVVQDNLSANIIRYFLSLQYYDWPGWRSGRKTMWYSYSGLGAVSHNFSGSVILREYGTGDLYEMIGSGDSTTKFAMTFGAGLVQLIAERTGIQFGITGDLLFIGKNENIDSYDNIQRALIFDLQVGIVQVF